MKKPTFDIQDLQVCVKETRARIAAERVQVERLEKWAEEIARSEDQQGNVSGDLERLQQELLSTYAELPAVLDERFAEALARAAETEVGRLEASAAAEGDAKKKAATK